MTEETENLVLDLLRKMRAEQQAMALDVLDIKARMTSLEESQGTMMTMYASQSRRIDRIDERLGRIEKRLDLVEEPHP